MMRTHALLAALFSLLPPSAAAAPPVRVEIAPAVSLEQPESPLSARRAADRALIAFHYAPIHYQEVDRTGGNGLEGRADYVTRVNFDGDWDPLNNWENAARYPLPGAAYHAVIETPTHWFVTVMFFHPRDWAASLFDTEHENDSEGVLLAVRRDGSMFGRLEAGVTVVHSDFYSFVPSRGRWSAGFESVDGVLELDAGSGRPMTTQEARGHALRARKAGAHFDGIVYHPSLAPSEMPAEGHRTASYVLIDLFEAGGLWERRDDPKLFAKHGSFAGDRGGRCGSGGILCTLNAANAPWGWDDGDDGSVERGSIAGDPAKLVARYFRTPEAVSERYTYNPYRPGAERSTAPLVAQARRIPGSERVSAAGPAENGRRFTGRLAPRGP